MTKIVVETVYQENSILKEFGGLYYIQRTNTNGYASLLANKLNFIELLRSFIQKDKLSTLTEANLTLLSHTLISPSSPQVESDLIFKWTKESGALLFYLLMTNRHPQSAPFLHRLLEYKARMWLHQIEMNVGNTSLSSPSGRLAEIFPIVIYGGKEPWKAKQQFSDIIGSTTNYSKYALDFRYQVIDVNRIKRSKLLSLRNVVGSAFYLEQAENIPDLIRRLQSLAKRMEVMDARKICRFMSWLTGILPPSLAQQIQISYVHLEGLSAIDQIEVKKYMITNIERLLNQLLQEVNEAKSPEKIKEARKKGQIEIAHRLMARGMSADVVADLTGLPEHDILK